MITVLKYILKAAQWAERTAAWLSRKYLSDPARRRKAKKALALVLAVLFVYWLLTP